MQPCNISGTVRVEDAALSSESDSTSSEPNTSPSLKDKKAKLDLAYNGRLIQDNLRVLQQTADQNLVRRSLSDRLQEAQVNKAISDLGGQPTGAVVASQNKSDDMGDIIIDSPTTHHHYPTPTAPPETVPPIAPVGVPGTDGAGLSGGQKAGVVSAIILGLAGLGTGAATLLKPGEPVPPPAVKKWQAVYYTVNPDGSEKIIKTEPLK